MDILDAFSGLVHRRRCFSIRCRIGIRRFQQYFKGIVFFLKDLLMNEEFAGRIISFFRCGFVDIRCGARGKEETQYDSVTVRFFHSANSSLFR